MIIDPSQAWSMLQRHAADVQSIRLAELRNNANEEVANNFMTVHETTTGGDGSGDSNHLLIFDWSRQRMTSETINHLLRLSAARQIHDRIRDLAYGRLAPGSKLQRTQHHGNNNNSAIANDFLSAPTVSFAHDLYNRNKTEVEGVEDMEEGGTMHLALRAPANKGMKMRDPYSKSNNNALDEIHKEWNRIQLLTDSLRNGTLRGASGRPLCDVLVVSAGGTVVPHALEFIYQALSLHNRESELASLVDSDLVSFKTTSPSGVCNHHGGIAPSKSGLAIGVIDMVTTPFKNKSNQGIAGFASQSNPCNFSSFRRRKLEVLTSIDPCAQKEVLSKLSPATTMVITLSIDAEKDRECSEITMAVKDWLMSGLLGTSVGGDSGESGIDKKAQIDGIAQKHMFVVTGKEESVKKKSKSNVFLVPRHSRCEAFSTCSSAGLLPLSFIFGWKVASSFLSGAHDIDCHFVDTNPRHNLAIIISLVDVWNDAFLNSCGRIISPYVQSFRSYPGVVAAMEDKILNGPRNGSMSSQNKSTLYGGKDGPSPVISGSSHDLYQNSIRHSQTLSTEFMMTMEPSISSGTDYSSLANHDSRICSLYALADTLAFGSSNIGGTNKGRCEISSPGSPPMIQSVDSVLSHSSTNGNGGENTWTMPGNQPSNLLVCGTCDAFTCGQLVALAEHRAMVKAWLWDIDPFASSKQLSLQEEHRGYLSSKLHKMYHLLSTGEGVDEADEETETHAAGMGMYSTTNLILKQYATRIQKHRHHMWPK